MTPQVKIVGNDPEPLGPISSSDLGDLTLAGAQFAEVEAAKWQESIDDEPTPTPDVEEADVGTYLRLTKVMTAAGQLTQSPSLAEVPPAVLRLPEAGMVDYLRSVEAQRELGQTVHERSTFAADADDLQARDRAELLEVAREALDEGEMAAWDQAVFLSEEDGEAAEEYIREWASLDPSAVTAFVSAYPRHEWAYLQDGDEQLAERDQARADRQVEQQHAAVRSAVDERWAELGQDPRWSGALEVAGELLRSTDYRPETPEAAREAVDVATKVARAQIRTEAALANDPFVGQLAKMDQRLMEGEYLRGELGDLEPRHADLDAYRDAVVTELISRPDTLESIARRATLQPGDAAKEITDRFDAEAERAASPNAAIFAEALAGSRAEKAAEAKRRAERRV